MADYPAVNPKNGRPAGMISKEIFDIVQENAALLDSAVIYERDFHYNLWVLVICSYGYTLTPLLALASRLSSGRIFSVSMAESLNVPSTCSCESRSEFMGETSTRQLKPIIS